MSLASARMDYDSSSTPSPVQRKSEISETRYSNCQYHHGKYCVSKICTIVVLLIFTTLAGLSMAGLSLFLDNWAGISTNPYATLDMPYPRLGFKPMDYVMFEKTIPNDSGTLYKYIDSGEDKARYLTSRYGLLSHCKVPVQGPKIALFETPWKAPVCRASWDEFQCPIVAMKTLYGEEPMSPRALSYRTPINGCIKKTQRCDGVIDCPTGHDELNCPQPEEPCGEGMIQCSDEKPICISKHQVCNGLNDCGMYEDEQNCCGRVGFVRCGDGSCVLGERCDAMVDCFDLSDEYDCPDPASGFYTKCKDGQLIESTYMCENKEYASFQCKDLSDETQCDYEPEPLLHNRALRDPIYDNQEKCFKQSFTFEKLNQTQMDQLYPSKRHQEFMKAYEYSSTKLAIIGSIGVSAFLGVISIGLLLCFGNLNKRCKVMRITFCVLAGIYLLCIIQTLITGIYWQNYVSALNDVIENPTGSNMHVQVATETVKVTGGLATIRISTQLTFYNCGFYGLAFILCLVAAHLLKNASCHTQGSISFTTDYKRNMYSDDLLTANDLLLSTGSSNNSGDNGIATPDQIVTPHRSIRSYDANLLQAARSNATLPIPSRFYSHNHINGSNTYVSYKDIDSMEKINTLSHPLTVTTLDRSTVRSTPV